MEIPGLLVLSFEKIVDIICETQSRQFFPCFHMIYKITVSPKEVLTIIPTKAASLKDHLSPQLLISSWVAPLWLNHPFKKCSCQKLYNKLKWHLGLAEHGKDLTKDEDVEEWNENTNDSSVVINLDSGKECLNTNDENPTHSCGHLDNEECETEMGNTNTMEITSKMSNDNISVTNKCANHEKLKVLKQAAKSQDFCDVKRDNSKPTNNFITTSLKSNAKVDQKHKTHRQQIDDFLTTSTMPRENDVNNLSTKVLEEGTPINHWHYSRETLQQMLAGEVKAQDSLYTPKSERIDEEIESEAPYYSVIEGEKPAIKFLPGNDKFQIAKHDIKKTNDKDCVSSSAVRDAIKLKPVIINDLKVSKELRNFIVNILHPVIGIPWDVFEKETMRLASFSNYPSTAIKSPDHLAASGFVYIGDGRNDRVKCFFCLAENEGWRREDDIDQVHKSLSPNCPLVRVQLTNNVASVTTRRGYEDITQFSSAIPCDSGAFTSGAAAQDSGENNRRLTNRNNQRNNHSAYDEVDYREADTNGQQREQQRRELTASSVAADPSFSLFVEGSSNMQTGQPLAPQIPQGLNPTPNSTLPSAHSSAHIMNNLSREHNTNMSRNTEYRHQNVTSTQNQVNSSHPVINSQIYSIPATAPSGTPTIPTTTSNTTLGPSTESSSSEPNPQLTYQLLGIFHERPKYPENAVYSRRLQSFEDWPSGHLIKKEELARAGLFFAGYGDCCKCFFCGGGLRNWEDGDHPLVEHARWFKKCGFIRQYMGQEFVDAVEHLNNTFSSSITLENVTKYMRERGLNLQYFSSERTITDDAAVRSLIDGGYPREAVVRAATSLRESGESLSADVLLRKMHEINAQASAAAVATTSTAEAEDMSDEASRLRALKEQNDALRKNLICKICMDKEVRIVFLPCGHLVCCQECAIAMNDCPVCRQHIRARARANIH